MKIQSLALAVAGAMGAKYIDEKLAATDGPIEGLRGDANKTARRAVVGGAGVVIAWKAPGSMKPIGAGMAIYEGAAIGSDMISR